MIKLDSKNYHRNVWRLFWRQQISRVSLCSCFYISTIFGSRFKTSFLWTDVDVTPENQENFGPDFD